VHAAPAPCTYLADVRGDRAVFVESATDAGKTPSSETFSASRLPTSQPQPVRAVLSAATGPVPLVSVRWVDYATPRGGGGGEGGVLRATAALVPLPPWPPQLSVRQPLGRRALEPSRKGLPLPARESRRGQRPRRLVVGVDPADRGRGAAAGDGGGPPGPVETHGSLDTTGLAWAERSGLWRSSRGEALSLGAPSKYLAGEVFRRPAGALRRGSAGRCKGWRIPLGIRTRVVHGPVSSDHQRGRFHRTVSERERAPVQASCLSRCGGRVTKTVTTGRDSPLSRGPRRCTVSRAATRFFSQSITAQRGIVSFPAGCRRFAPGRPLL
jgi:hypothetical protein